MIILLESLHRISRLERTVLFLHPRPLSTQEAKAGCPLASCLESFVQYLREWTQEGIVRDSRTRPYDITPAVVLLTALVERVPPSWAKTEANSLLD
jgi:hypothetical protein